MRRSKGAACYNAMKLSPAWMNRDLGLLLTGRTLRSLVQSYLAILVPIYVAKLGFDALHVGYLFTASAVASAALAAVVGLLSDRFGRRNLLIVISLMSAAAGVLFASANGFAMLALAAALGTVGRTGPAGAGGSVGPYFPAEQALIAEHSSDAARTTVFGALAFVGVVAGAVGSLMAASPHAISAIFATPLLDGYRALFWTAAVAGVAMALVTVPISERPRETAARESARAAYRNDPAPANPAGRKVLGLSRSSWWFVVRFGVINGTNGFAIGMLGPFVVYWFYRQFGASASQIASLFFIINLAAGIPNLMVGRISREAGTLNTIVVARAISSTFLLAMVAMPTYFMAALMYALRSVIGALWVPARQSYLMGMVDRSERATAAGLTNLPLQVTSLVSPPIAGVLMQEIALGLPIALAAILQALTAAMYYGFFHGVRPPEEEAPTRGMAGAARHRSE